MYKVWMYPATEVEDEYTVECSFVFDDINNAMDFIETALRNSAETLVIKIELLSGRGGKECQRKTRNITGSD